MYPILKRVPVLAAMAAFVVLIGWQVDAEPTRTTMPNVEDLVHYTTVKRGNVTEHMMTTREAVAAVKAGQPVPDGTHFVLVDYRDGKLYRYFVMQKGRGWGDDYGEERRTGNWQFQWFQPDGGINVAENTARCQSCHSSSADNDFLFTFDRLKAFNGSVTD
jgi:Cytochrome P460